MARAAPAAAVAILLGSVVGVGGVYLTRSPAPQHRVKRTTDFRVISFPEKSKYELVQAGRGAISTLPTNLSIGMLMAYVPTQPVTDELLLFLPGTTQACSFYAEFLENVARFMRVLCLPYDNRGKDMLCQLDPDCIAMQRFEAFDGDFLSVANNSIEGRLTDATTYLIKNDDASWANYLDSSVGSRLPRWSSFRVAGHSLGASNAAIIGYERKVARVVQIAGVCDRSTWPERLVPLTPSERWFALGHAEDGLCSPSRVTIKHWVAEGILRQGEEPLQLYREADISPSFLGQAHAVVSHIPWPANCSGVATWDCAHDSIAGAVWGGRGVSPYPPIWLSLVGL